MNKKINYLLVSILFSISAFIYLSVHHYSIKTGAGGMTLCSLSATVNCDAAALSSYSELFHIPVAILGGVFQFILFFFVLFYKVGWIDPTLYARNTIRFQLAFSALTSLVMGAISLFIIKVTCPFCFATYFFSFVSLILGWSIVETTEKEFDFAKYFSEYRSHIFALASVPVISWFISGMTLSHYRLDEIQKIVPEKIAIWQAGTEYAFDPNVGISTKTENAKYTLVEFADFKCPHCKLASQTLSLFLQNRKDVRFIFKPFPLDSGCNPALTSPKGDGSRCTLAGFALCAEKIEQKGLEMTHWLFEHQEEFYTLDPKAILAKAKEHFGLDEKAMSECADSAETYAHLTRGAEEGKKANVEGTPTIYLNGKMLPGGQILDVLMSATRQ